MSIFNWVVLALLAVPVIININELRKTGLQDKGQAARRLLLIAPAALGVYLLNTGHPIFGMVVVLAACALSVFLLFAYISGPSGVSAALASAGVGDDLVRRGSRVVDARLSGIKDAGTDITIGGVVVPGMLEAQHFLISGTTGAGKTQVINGMLRTIRKRRQRAVIADPAGGFYARFGEGGDVLVNPFDKRSVAWSPFAEIRADYDCERIAKAIVPDGAGDGAEWHHYAQTLIAQSMLAMHRQQEKSIKRLLYWLTTADQKELGGLLTGFLAALV